MPNHTKTFVSFECKDGKQQAFNEMCNYLLSSKDASGKVYPLDFELIIPSPENMFRGPLGLKEEAECAAAGIPTWHKWQSENWGTKWNLYDSVVLSHDKGYRLCIGFETAWDFPKPIADALAKKYADVAKIEFITACEGGWFAGVYTSQPDGSLGYCDLKQNCWAIRQLLRLAKPEK